MFVFVHAKRQSWWILDHSDLAAENVVLYYQDVTFILRGCKPMEWRLVIFKCN